MIAKQIKCVAKVGMLLAGLSACKTINIQSAMPEGTLTNPPRGYVELCERSPSECVIPLDKKTKDQLVSLNNRTKDMIIPTAESGDFWKSISARSEGDCEDFALTLRKLLRERLPEYSAAFLLATAYTEDAQYHAVLTIETTAGTLVCDIRFPQCAPWESFPYDWHLREVPNKMHWEDIGDKEVIASIWSASISD